MNDRRYHGSRWRKTAKAVVLRDRHVCQVIEGCQRMATVADHIDPVYEGMPDHEFYAMSNLRAACKHHNLRRGHVERFQRELEGTPAPVRRSPYSIGGPRLVKSGARGETRKAGPFLRDAADNDVGSSRVDLQACKLEYSIVSPK